MDPSAAIGSIPYANHPNPDSPGMFNTITARILTLTLGLLLSAGTGHARLLNEPDPWFFGLLRHIDTWYLSDLYHFEPDEDEIIPVHINRLDVPLGENDNSRFYAVDFPEIQLYLVLKQSDFNIEELDLTVTNTQPKIVSVTRYIDSSPMPAGFQRRELAESVANRLLYEDRFRPANWSDEQLNKLNHALESLLRDKSPLPAGQQIFHVAPHSEYSTAVHVYWENARKIIILSSGPDFNTDAYWQLLPLNTEIIDLDEDVVSTLLLVPGSNAYVTQAWAARIVYHCVVKGQRLAVDAL